MPAYISRCKWLLESFRLVLLSGNTNQSTENPRRQRREDQKRRERRNVEGLKTRNCRKGDAKGTRRKTGCDYTAEPPVTKSHDSSLYLNVIFIFPPVQSDPAITDV